MFEFGAVDPHAIPPILLFLAVLVTHLGNPLLALGVVTGLYWTDSRYVSRLGLERRQLVTLFAIVLCAIATVELTKTVFDVPRPSTAGNAGAVLDLPAALAGLSEESLEQEGDAFPSGHVVSATVLWGGLASLSESRLRSRVVAATSLIALVAGSRLLLGVHSAVDLAGAVIVGVLLLLVLRTICLHGASPDRAFGLALAVAVVGIGVVGLRPEMVMVLGGALGGLTAWQAVGQTTSSASTGKLTAIVGVAVAGPLLVVAEGAGSWVVAIAGAAIATTWLVSAPRLTTAIER